MQNVVNRKCDKCDERATCLFRNSEGEERLCDKHWKGSSFNPDLKGRREEQIRRVAYLVGGLRNMDDNANSTFEIAERILKELGL